MWNSKKRMRIGLMVAALSTQAALATLGTSTAALAIETDESIAARAEKFESKSGAAPEAPASSDSNDYESTNSPGGLVIYRNDARGSVAARISRISRYKNYLFVLDQFGHESRLVPYFSESGARADYHRLAGGQAVDLSRCMVEDLELSAVVIDAKQGCVSRTYTLKVDCDRLTSIPNRQLSGAEEAAFTAVDIDQSPMTESRTLCLDTGPKF